jgi:hypothetical protein
VSERSPTPLRQATKKVRMISRLLIMVQDSIYRQPGLTARILPVMTLLKRVWRYSGVILAAVLDSVTLVSEAL